MPRLLTALACGAALAALVACGESEQEQAREVVQEYVDATNSDDFDRVCDLYSDSLKRELGAADCPAFVQEQSSGVETELELVEVRVSGEKATADIDSGSEQEGPARLGLTLEREDEEWRITGFQ
jgi:ketosteroid isomerase-like protein